MLESSSCSVCPACWLVLLVLRACLTYTDRWRSYHSALRRCGTRAREEAGSAAAGAARARHWWRRCPPRRQRRRGGWWPVKARMPASGHACVRHALEARIGNLFTRPQPASAAAAELAGGLALPFLPGMSGEVGVGGEKLTGRGNAGMLRHAGMRVHCCALSASHDMDTKAAAACRPCRTACGWRGPDAAGRRRGPAPANQHGAHILPCTARACSCRRCSTRFNRRDYNYSLLTLRCCMSPAYRSLC